MRSLLVSLMLAGPAAFAHNVLTCNTVVYSEKGRKTISIFVDREDQKFTARSPELRGDQVFPVDVSEMSVREGLSAQMDVDAANLNVAERLVLFPLMVASGDAFKDQTAPLGIDLEAIRFAKVYHIDPNPNDNIGMFALVEAKDAEGKPLGTFLSGLLFGACK